MPPVKGVRQEKNIRPPFHALPDAASAAAVTMNYGNGPGASAGNRESQ